MDDADLVEITAQQWVEKLGRDAPTHLKQRAECSAREGDELSAEAWRDIAEAAERMIA